MDEEEKRVIQKANFIIILLGIFISAFLVFVAVYYYGADYETGDDFAMSALASGTWGYPTSRIVYMNIIFGYLLKSLYGINQSVNWIVLVYFLMLFVSNATIVYNVLKSRRKFLIILYVLMLSIFYDKIFIIINFTKISAFVCCAGYILIYQSIDDKRLGPKVLASLLLISVC